MAKKNSKDSELDEWWPAFFEAGAADQMEAAQVKDNRGDAEWALSCLDLSAPASLLDVPCGEGRVSRELAAMGCLVTGVDFHGGLLEEARRRAQERRLSINFEQRDMRALTWENAFDGALCYFGSFGYFDEAGNRTFVEAVARALKPGGRFLVETQTLETLLPVFKSQLWHEHKSGVRLLHENSFDPHTSRIESTWTTTAGDGLEKVRASLRIYSYRELRALFEACGFTRCRGFCTVSKEPFELGAMRLSFVGEKK